MKVGFIGLGTQGKHLAINLAKSEHDAMVYDVRREPLDELAAAGAQIAVSSKDIGAHGDIIEVCVLDDVQLKDVILGEDGVLAGARPGAIIAVHSTVEPGTITSLAATAEKRGVELIDAPVSGSENGAKSKTMSYMVGGTDQVFETLRPIFEISGPKITHTGPLGTGIRAKLAHQLIICVNMMAAHEGMRLGIVSGLPADILEQVVREGMAQSSMANQWSKLSLAPRANPVFYKDLQLCLKFAHELGLSTPGAALAQQLLDDIVP